jgi:hypothetical protein
VSTFEDNLFDDDQLDKFRDRESDPLALMALLRDDTEFLVAVAKADTRPHLLSWFGGFDIERGAGWSHEPERTGPIGENAAGVEWKWEGTHSTDETFNKITASGQEVTVHGFTLMSIERDRVHVRRYIDWAGLFAQLGLTLNWRTPVSNEAEGPVDS